MSLNGHRFGAFATVGTLGFVLQVTALSLLTSLAHWMWLPATLVAVELAVVHNFLWHERWTWRERKKIPDPLFAWRFARFNVARHLLKPLFLRMKQVFGSRSCLSAAALRPPSNEDSPSPTARLSLGHLRRSFVTGLASVAGNIALMWLFVGWIGLPPVAANVLAVGVMSVANFVMADRWVFAAAVAFALMAPSNAFAAPAQATLDAWQRYVAQTEAQLEQTRGGGHEAARDSLSTRGESIGVPSGTISHWRGSVFIVGVTLDRLLDGLMRPGTPPPQEDVVASRVLSRGNDSLRVYMRLVRRAIVTVSYDTEHEMTFNRRSPLLATARSVATRIEEVGGNDHGFLWRLHSYWRYEQKPGGVLVELDSLTLSRDVPSLVRPIAAPLVNRIARESMHRTLDALRRFFQKSA